MYRRGGGGVKKFHGDSVKNESARAKKKLEGGRQTSPPSLFRVKAILCVFDVVQANSLSIA